MAKVPDVPAHSFPPKQPLTIEDVGGDPTKLASIDEFLREDPPQFRVVARDRLVSIGDAPIRPSGMDRIADGTCPLGFRMLAACWFCDYGHATDCHHPQTCVESRCSHYLTAIAEGGLQ